MRTPLRRNCNPSTECTSAIAAATSPVAMALLVSARYTRTSDKSLFIFNYMASYMLCC